MSEQAKRVNKLSEIDMSSICYWKDTQGWWFYIPKCGIGGLGHHQVEEHEDGTITVTPSISLEGHLGKRHGFLTKGQWKDA